MKHKRKPDIKQDVLITLSDKDRLPLSVVEKIENDPMELNRYKKRYHHQFYRLLIFSLTHEWFPENQCREFWCGIVKHHTYLNCILNRNVGLTVASADYMSNIIKKLPNPKIISEHKIRAITKAATRDALTNLYVRDVFDLTLKKQCIQANKHGQPVSLMLIDIDDFKQINDHYGHLQGDRVLSSISDCITTCIRETDVPARYGGEELAVIMPRTDLQDAIEMAERIRHRIQSNTIDNIHVSASIGVAKNTDLIKTPEQLIKSADDALYCAKEEGKNRVRCSIETDAYMRNIPYSKAETSSRLS